MQKARGPPGRPSGSPPHAADLVGQWSWCLYRDGRAEEAEGSYRRLVSKLGRTNGPMAGDVRERLRTARMVLSNLALARGDSAQRNENSRWWSTSFLTTRAL